MTNKLLIFISISGIINAVTSTILCIFVYQNNRKNLVNRTFAMFALYVALWSYPYLFWPLAQSKAECLFWFRMLHVGAILIPVGFYHFVISFLSKENRRSIIPAYLLSAFFLIFSFSKYYIPDMKPVASLPFYGIPGILYVPFLAMFFGYVVYSLYLMFSNYLRCLEPERKAQILLIGIGTMIGFIGGSTNYLPWFNIPIPPFLNCLVAVYVVMTAYAIVKHGFLDIEVIIKKTLVFASLFTIVFGIFIGVTLLTQQFIAGSRLIGLAISSVIIIFTVRPVEIFLIRITDKYLFQKKYDYRQVMESFIDDVVTLLDLDKIITGTLELLDKTLHPQDSAILLLNSGKDKYILNSIKIPSTTQSVENNSAIVGYLKTVKDVLSIENDNDKKISEEMKMEMNNLKATLAVPLMLRDELIGIMLLGKKKSDEYYTKEDINILLDLARTEAIALKNAEFIKERDAMHMEMTQAKLKEELATMADGMSHQFNNKFQGISSAIRFAKQMLTQNDMTSQSKEKIKDIMTQAEDTALAAGDIATGLLNFTRPKRVQYDMVNIASNINVALQLVEYKHKDFNQIEVIKKVEENLPLTYAHLGYFQEIYFIAIDNAYDAIQYRMYDEPNLKGRIDILVSSDKKTNEIVVSIADNGSGMKPDVLENVRNAIPYFTTKASSGKSGYGAGTQVLRRLVDFHKGKISYDSTYGDGATVTMRIPITQKPKDSDLIEEGKANG